MALRASSVIGDVRLGSLADIGAALGDVCSWGESRHSPLMFSCPRWCSLPSLAATPQQSIVPEIRGMDGSPLVPRCGSPRAMGKYTADRTGLGWRLGISPIRPELPILANRKFTVPYPRKDDASLCGS